MPLRVLLADDHQIVRQGFRILLEREGFEIVGEAASGVEAIRLAQAEAPDVAVLDLSMPYLNGLDAAREILRTCPETRIILLTVHAEDHQIVAAFRAGIRGYVVKTQAAADLVQALPVVAGGGVYLSPAVSRVLVDGYLEDVDLPHDPLTPLERDVLQLIAEGKTTKEIATLLGLSAASAESYQTRIMDKLEIHDTAGLVRCAIRRGMIQP